MAVSERKKESNARWDKANTERISLVLRTGERDQIKARANELDVPVNRYIRGLILDDLSRAKEEKNKK